LTGRKAAGRRSLHSTISHQTKSLISQHKEFFVAWETDALRDKNNR
jgi:hypothetical protein